MAKYAIGDIQGCYQQFIKLLNKISFNPSKDELYLVGDLVNRGPQSLEVLEYVYRYQDSIKVVLGNHDLYLLGRFSGVIKPHATDTIGDILRNKKAKMLIDWLRRQALIYCIDRHILVHAGIYPCLDFSLIYQISEEIRANLSSLPASYGGDINSSSTKTYGGFLRAIYSDAPVLWQLAKSDYERMCFIVNACCRMRYLNQDNHYALDFKHKESTTSIAAPSSKDHLIPWFRVPVKQALKQQIVFGHWSSLGFCHEPRFIALDTGCVWGRLLTAIDLDTYIVYQVS